jgi:hypothetical protein
MKLKITTKITTLFVFVILLSFTQVMIIHKLQGSILDNTKQIHNIEAPLEILAEKGAGYDSMKTQIVCAALLFAQKGDYENAKTLKANYYDPAVDGIISNYSNHQVANLVTQSQRSQEQKVKTNEYFNRLNENGVKISALETQAFEAIDKKDLNTAATIVTGEEYAKYKIEMTQDAKDWQDLERQVILSDRSNILKISQEIIYLNLVLSLFGTLLFVGIALLMRSFLSQLLSRKK